MDGSHYHHPAMMFPAVFPAVFPTAPPPPPQTVQSVVPAKRDDDDVQFLSSNPVKKRKVDGYQPIMPPTTTTTTTMTTTTQSTQPTPVGHHPDAATSQQPPEPVKQAVLNAHPERRGSTGMVGSSSTTHLTDVDVARGCSVPIPERCNYSESFWTAPSTGPHSSPPVSPKTLPENVRPSMLRLDEGPGPAPGPASGGLNGGAATSNVGFPGSAHLNNNPTNVSQPPVISAEGTPLQIHSDNQMQTETAKDIRTVETLPELAGGTDIGEAVLEPPAAATADSTNRQQQQAKTGAISSGINYNQSGTPVEPKQTLTAPILAFQRNRSPNKIPDAQNQPHTHHPPSRPSPMTSLAHIPLHPSAHAPSHGTSSTQADPCGNRTTKGPCRQCLEARMRLQVASQAASMNAASLGLPPNAKVSSTNPTSAPSTAIQQPWTHMLGINPYHNLMAGAMYGPMLQQPMMTAQNGHFALPQQHPHFPHGLTSTQQTGGHMLSLPPAPSKSTTQPFKSVRANPTPTKPAPAPANRSTQALRAPETQLATKHIIVDIADTCLNIFPFKEVAKRHNQPEQKIRDIFSAVVQVPLLRCNTDKRRAGKLGTARVKEFNQAKKDIQAQASANQSPQDTVNQGPYMPSVWEMAQFMGPSDLRFGTLPQFSGLW